MRLAIILVAVCLSLSASADELVYLTCNGLAKDTELNTALKETKNDFLINKKTMTIQQIITGMSAEETRNLRQKIKDSGTQYISENGMIAINKHTLEYSVSGFMGLSINGRCKVVKPEI